MYKNEKKKKKFGHVKIQKQQFHQRKGPISTKNVVIDKIFVPNKVPFGKKGFKYFIGYKDPKKISLYVYFSQK